MMEHITSPLPFADYPNPFGPLVGQPLDDTQVDIVDINSEAFEACRRLVDDVAAGFSAALTVFGDTGTGKTHLTGRVRRWLEPQPGRLFVFVRMETSAAGIWRHLRRSLALALLRADSAGVRNIDRLFAHRKPELEQISHRDLSIVLENLLEGRHVRDSAAWLRGEGLPEEVLTSLRLTAPGPDDEPEVTARHVVTAICDLIRPGVVVWCMDQIEAVMSSPTDRDGPHAFGQTGSFLVDQTRNSAVICCEQITFMLMMEQILDEAVRSRLLGRRAAIRQLTWEQAQRLIAARLDTVLDRTGHSGCWPLTESKIKAVFKDNAAPARQVIARCKDLFETWRTGQATPEEPLDTVLQRMLEERFTSKEPAETDAILRNAIPLLTRSAGLPSASPGNRSPLDFTIDNGRLGVAICNEPNARTFAAHLKKVAGAWKPAASRRLLLLRDARLPISRTAKASLQRIAEIQQQGGRLVTVSQEAVDALAALRRLLSDAESGDLAHRGEPIAPNAVEQWIAGHLPDALDPLLSEFGASRPPSAGLDAALAALLAEKKIIRLEDAARSLEVTPGEIEQCAERDPRQFGILRGSMAALFQPVTVPDAR